MILELEIQDASFLDVEDLNKEKGRLARLLAMVKRAEEEFFRKNERELRPPGQATIDETIRLSTELGDRIAEEKKAEAIVNLNTRRYTYLAVLGFRWYVAITIAIGQRGY